MSETCYEDGSDDDDLYFYGNAAPPLAVPVSAGEVIPDQQQQQVPDGTAGVPSRGGPL